MKQLAQVDIEQGIALHDAYWAALQAAAKAEADLTAYVRVMRLRYDATEELWTLTDWLEGFVPVEQDEALAWLTESQ